MIKPSGFVVYRKEFWKPAQIVATNNLFWTYLVYLGYIRYGIAQTVAKFLRGHQRGAL